MWAMPIPCIGMSSFMCIGVWVEYGKENYLFTTICSFFGLCTWPFKMKAIFQGCLGARGSRVSKFWPTGYAMAGAASGEP